MSFPVGISQVCAVVRSHMEISLGRGTPLFREAPNPRTIFKRLEAVQILEPAGNDAMPPNQDPSDDRGISSSCSFPCDWGMPPHQACTSLNEAADGRR